MARSRAESSTAPSIAAGCDSSADTAGAAHYDAPAIYRGSRMSSGYDQAVYLMYLAQVPMFSTCTPQDLEEVAALATPKHVDIGDVIVHEGDAGDEFYVLASGSALVR